MTRKNLDLSQTIFSLVSGPLPSAVAIFRLSGPDAFSYAQRLFRTVGNQALTRSRGMHFGVLKDEDGRKIDEVLVLAFVAPHSFTGEDSVEFQCHGSPAILSRLETALLTLGGRPAERGEFSYRAFVNGKLSANALENLGDVFAARRFADIEQIYKRQDGSFAKAIASLRERLLRLQAILDTAVDFADEYSHVLAQAEAPLVMATHECSALLERYTAFRAEKQQPRLVLAGKPNAGKSSLFNAFLRRYRAIVHETPGTTRDVIEEDFELNGSSWKLVDTAGMRSGTSPAEREGISLGTDYLGASSFWLLVVDGTLGLQPEDQELLDRYGSVPHLLLWNKCDAPQWQSPPLEIQPSSISISARSGEGLPVIWEKLQLLTQTVAPSGPLPTASEAARLKKVLAELEQMRELFEAQVGPEYLGESSRSLLRSLESVLGEVDPEEILDRVFSEFCIGK